MSRVQMKETPDPSVPYSVDNGTECFGKQWNPRESTCSNCPAINACGSYQMLETQKVINQLQEAPYLSRCSFDKVDEQSLIDTIKGIKPTKETVLSLVSEESGFVDTTTLSIYLDKLISKYNLTIDNGLIY